MLVMKTTEAVFVFSIEGPKIEELLIAHLI